MQQNSRFGRLTRRSLVDFRHIRSAAVAYLGATAVAVLTSIPAGEPGIERFLILHPLLWVCVYCATTARSAVKAGSTWLPGASLNAGLAIGLSGTIVILFWVVVGGVYFLVNPPVEQRGMELGMGNDPIEAYKAVTGFLILLLLAMSAVATVLAPAIGGLARILAGRDTHRPTVTGRENER